MQGEVPPSLDHRDPLCADAHLSGELLLGEVSLQPQLGDASADVGNDGLWIVQAHGLPSALTRSSNSESLVELLCEASHARPRGCQREVRAMTNSAGAVGRLSATNYDVVLSTTERGVLWDPTMDLDARRALACARTRSRLTHGDSAATAARVRGIEP